MSDWPYTDQELQQYFEDADARLPEEEGLEEERQEQPSEGRFKRFYRRISRDDRKRQAFHILAAIVGVGLFVALVVAIYFASFAGELPNFEQLDNPSLQLATVAYTADGEELQRYARQNRSWVEFEDISPSVINALIATEDHRFYKHSGIDVVRTLAIPYHVLRLDPQGGSTITQQLARNLYNDQIGRERTVKRKLKEMFTAIQLERRYTKREVVEMYLNTVEFANNAYGIDAAARTFFSTTPAQLDTLQSATLVGMLKALTYYNPVRNPENSRRRRNVVLSQMVKRGVLDDSYYQSVKEVPVETNYRSSDITSGLAPYFAEYVRNQGVAWAKQNGYDFYVDGLVIYTTLDSKLQAEAQAAVAKRTEELQKVVDYEWSRAGGYALGTTTDPYVAKTDYEPFAHYWKANPEYTNAFIRESGRFRSLRNAGLTATTALDSLKRDTAFMDSVKAEKTRLEAGLVSVDPTNGEVKAWVGGRDLTTDWFDHVALAKRQPGSTFKPFVYTSAIDNGYSPYHMLRDTTFLWTDGLGNEWSPTNSGEDAGTGELVTLREGLVKSKNTITGQLVLMVSPKTVAFYARRMGVKSRLDEVPSLALGVSDVTLLEMVGAYSTLVNGLAYEPVVISRIEDRHGNVLFENTPIPREALSEQTAFTVVDMMRGVIREGTGIRLMSDYNLREYDFAGKTGTTQNNADGWFIAMHPQLVTGAWVGFNDRRVAFRSNWWGQGAHNALFMVGDFLQSIMLNPDTRLENVKFEAPPDYSMPIGSLDTTRTSVDPLFQDKANRQERGRVGW